MAEIGHVLPFPLSESHEGIISHQGSAFHLSPNVALNSLLTWFPWLLFQSQHYQMVFLNCNRDCLLLPAFQVLKWLLSTSWTMSKFHDVVQQGPLVTWLPHPYLLPSPPVCSLLLHPFCNSLNAWNAFLPLFYLENSYSPARFIRCHSSVTFHCPSLLPPLWGDYQGLLLSVF